MSVIDLSKYSYVLASRLRQYARHAVGRVTGTVVSTAGRYKHAMDQEECRLFFRAEINALVGILVAKKIFTMEEWTKALCEEYEVSLKDNAEKWPEIKVADDGRSYVLNLEGFKKRVNDEGWPP